MTMTWQAIFLFYLALIHGNNICVTHVETLAKSSTLASLTMGYETGSGDENDN